MAAPPATPPPPPAPRPGALASLARAFTSWRTAAVTLQQIPSGLPLGLIWIALPIWLTTQGVDIKTIGFLTLAQLPWAFKFLWSPLMDRYAPPFLGRKRGWAVVAQAALLVAILGLAAAARTPHHLWPIALLSVLIAFAAASQDIAIDAYAVEVLHPDEQGAAGGARSAVARFAVFLSGRVVPSAAKVVSWPLLFAAQSLVFIPAAVLMWFSPEPAQPPPPPKTLRDAVWAPFVSFLRQRRAIEIVLFLVLYKFADNLATALVSPFLLQTGFDLSDVGYRAGTIGLLGAIVGSIVGGAACSTIGLGHCLWLFGFLQGFASIGYYAVAQVGPSRPLMYAAMALETGAAGMGTGAFAVLLLRLTQKQFSATQYALLSSVFALGRTIAGPIAGVLVDAVGWSNFFLLTIVSAAPGLIMLQRFVPLGVRDPEFEVERVAAGPPLRREQLLARAAGGCAAGIAVGGSVAVLLGVLRALHAHPGAGLALGPEVRSLVAPASASQWGISASVLVFGALCGLGWAALAAGRRGIAQPGGERAAG